MLPEEVFKRRHFNTPESFFLITTNYVVVALCIQFWALCNQIDWFFWVAMVLLAAYNCYKVYREREMYDKVRTISYGISLLGLIFMFFIFRSGTLHC